ncbi:UDP-glucuronosyl/UDP-glucosyltransferase [Macleaya cordata]|uniref:Glycosyltransferase n=1 Tax=Macleaya cordata TaxID=56857 RepID=A0A200QZG3_MACCD|nr:UDP-glucuronosyl/UDP-glucosyltransferase [Macleaya cordata]
MGSQNHHQLHIFFLPFIAPGHMIPMIDIARLFATRPGIKVTIIITTHNSLLFNNSIDRDIISGHQIQLHILKFPSSQVGLPEGIENFNSVTSPDMAPKLYQAISILQQSIEQLLRENHPDCIISDMFYPWTADLAKEIGCPRLVFQGTSFFSLSVMESIRCHKPHDTVSAETETFILPGLPDKIHMTRSQLPDHVRTRNSYSKLMDVIKESELRSYGVIVNSFYELEPSYADHYRNFMGRKAWQIGPVSLCIKREEKVEKHDCLSWLDSMKPNSVLYISFGSLSRFPKAQLAEIASGLEASGHPFIWVVRERGKPSEEEDDQRRWLKEDMTKGMIIRGWAPQVAILEHPAIGGFVTHCGWNSVLESVAAGVPMIAWPLYAEQFYNEKFVTEVMKIGVRVGVQEWNSLMEEGKVPVKKERVKEVVSQLMDGGDEGKEMRKRAKELGEMAKRVVEEGGSSNANYTYDRRRERPGCFNISSKSVMFRLQVGIAWPAALPFFCTWWVPGNITMTSLAYSERLQHYQ